MSGMKDAEKLVKGGESGQVERFVDVRDGQVLQVTVNIAHLTVQGHITYSQHFPGYLLPSSILPCQGTPTLLESRESLLLLLIHRMCPP